MAFHQLSPTTILRRAATEFSEAALYRMELGDEQGAASYARLACRAAADYLRAVAQ